MPAIRLFQRLAAVLAAAMLAAYLPTGQGADLPPSPTASADTRSATFGKFSHLGAYPQDEGNSSVTALTDGRILFYGVSMESNFPNTGKMMPLRGRLEFGAYRSVLSEPKIWDAARRGWVKLARPPECPHNSTLATVTALADGKVLIAGGTCDRPRMGDDTLPHVPHTAMSLWDSASGNWLPAPTMLSSRIFHSASLLKDNSVLIVGGESDPEGVAEGSEPVLDAVERYQAGKLEHMAPLAHARARHTATVLADGKLLVVGGFDGRGKAMVTAELWDPANAAWLELPPMHTARYGHAATLLDDGRVMVSGGKDIHGEPLGSVEMFDPATRTWSAGRPLLLPVYDHSALRLSSGNVLVAGGITLRPEAVREAMVWAKTTNEWHPAGMRSSQSYESRTHTVSLLPLADGGARVFGLSWIQRWAPLAMAPSASTLYGERKRFALTPLSDGRVLISGGMIGNAFADWAEVYDPATGLFTLTGRMQQARHSHSSVVLDDGSVMVAGGWVRSPDDASQPAGSSPELWQPATGRWRVIDDIRLNWQDRVSMGKLRDGSVLVFASRELEGETPQGPLQFRAWLWRPQSNRPQALTVPLTPRAGAAIAIRLDGTVLVAGGKRRTAEPDPDTSCRHRAQSDDERCHDKAVTWVDYAEPTTQLWDSRSGAVTSNENVPEHAFAEPMTLVLKNGNVVVADYKPINVYAGIQQLPVLLWNANSGRWSNLPRLNSSESLSLLELADGSLVSRGSRLPPGAPAWVKEDSVQFGSPQPVLTSIGMLLSIDTQAPYVTRYMGDGVRWQLVAPRTLAPAWRRKPALAALADGRLMVIANVESGTNPVQSAYLWTPASNTWTEAGRLARQYNAGQALAMPSGRVLHLGEFSASETVCEFWSPADQRWTFCGTLQRPADESSTPALRALADGSPAVISRSNEAMVFREASNTWLRMKLESNNESLAYGSPIRPEKGYYARVFDEAANRWIDASALAAATWQAASPQADALWDESKQQWAYVLPRLRGLGLDARFLPDGCALSSSPLRLFNPHTGAVETLADPGFGLTAANASMAVLRDGTVVLAGPERELFHRKASCKGFEPANDDALLMPPEWAKAIAPPAAPPPIVKALPLPTRLWNLLLEYKGLLLAILGPVFGYMLLSRLGRILRNLRARDHRDEDGQPGTIAWSRSFRWTVRAIFYLVAAVIIIQMLWGYLAFRKQMAEEQCAEQPASCLDKRTGLIEPIAAVKNDKTEGSDETRIPCRYIGIWSSIRPGSVYRITLSDDGRYAMAPNMQTGERGYSGFWAVQGKTMIWRHSQGYSGPDINPISDESEGRFTLTEENGSHTRFERIETIASSKCVR